MATWEGMNVSVGSFEISGLSRNVILASLKTAGFSCASELLKCILSIYTCTITYAHVAGAEKTDKSFELTTFPRSLVKR